MNALHPLYNLDVRENGRGRGSRRYSNNAGSGSGAARRKSSCNKMDGKKYQPFPDKARFRKFEFYHVPRFYSKLAF